MSNIYKIQPIDVKRPTLVINPATANFLGINNKIIVFVSFGSIRIFADIKQSGEVPGSVIQLSSKLIAKLHLPDYVEFEISVIKNEMIIGPYIGMLMSKEDKRLTSYSLERMKIYLKAYEELHGAVVVFALDKVDAIGRLVEGYCYNPVSQNFEKGIFPFPSSIYRTIGLSDYWKNCFLSVLGDKVFNNQYFDKWEMYKWFSANSDLSIKLPFTKVYRAAQDVFDLLDKFNKVYIKPVAGLGGRGIMQIQHDNGVYVFNYREDGVNLCEKLDDKDEAAEYIQYKFSHGRYLIQQAIELIKYRGGVVDFRCIMQKDQSQKWVCKAIIGRYGDRGSVVSNISSGGRAFKIDEIQERALPLSDKKISHLNVDLNVCTLQVCNTLDEYGLNCGMLGLDIGVDIEENLWLIEINNRDPDSSIALNVRDKRLYEELKTGLLFYAKSLAGFKKVTDTNFNLKATKNAFLPKK